MAWQTPKTNWTPDNGVRDSDFNRIEGNLLHLYNNENGAKRPATLVVGTSGHTIGAVDYLCDGAADQETLNAAIAALPATGGKIVLLDGTYNLSATVNINKPNVIIEGCGDATVLNSGVTNIVTVSAQYCAIKNMSFLGNSSANQVGVNITASASRCTVAGCTLSDIDNAIKIAATYSNVHDNTIYTSGLYGVSIQGNYAAVTNNYFNNCLVSIRAYYVSGAIITGNTVHASGATNGHGINIINTDTTVVANNVVRSAHIGIELYSYPAGSLFSSVANNLIIGCTNGIQLSNAHDNSVSFNLVQNEAYTSTAYSLYVYGSNKNAINCNRLIGKAYTEVMSTGNGYTGNLTI